MHNHYHFVYALLLCNADVITKIIANDRLIISFVLKNSSKLWLSGNSRENYVYYFALLLFIQLKKTCFWIIPKMIKCVDLFVG